MDDLLAVAVSAARTAGSVLLAGRGRARDVRTKSSATDMVSEMDLAAEAAIRSVIADARPGDAVLGEESGASTGETAVRWIVDPLDGTTNYLYGFPAWAVSVAAEVSGEVVAGAVFDPTHDEMWTCARGGGAWCNDTRLQPLADTTPLASALVATGFSYQSAVRATQGSVIARLLPDVRDIRRAGAAALDLCWVAAGRVDAYFEQGTHVWDWAAGALVAREVRAWVGSFDGGPPSETGLLAAPPALAAALRQILTG